MHVRNKFFEFYFYYFRWNVLSDAERRQAFPPVAPNLIVELRSYSQSTQNLHDKMLRWVNGGVEVSRQMIIATSFVDFAVID